MINLIPPAGQTALRKEYRMRVAATYCMLLAAVNILLTVALIPTYVLVKAQTEGVVAHSGEGEQDAEIASIEDEVARTEAIIAELKKVPETLDMSGIMHEIENAAPAGISFRTFTLNHVKGVIGPIQVQGNAEEREDLIAFKQALEAHSLFENASVPIGDLARERDVPFSMTITLASNTP
jgi:hypothetical protein